MTTEERLARLERFNRLLLLGLLGIRFWLKVVQISPAILGPLIFGVAFIGAYSIGGSLGDIVIMIVIGLIGYVMRKFKFPLVPLPMVRQAVFFDGDNASAVIH